MAAPSNRPIGLNDFAVKGWNDTLIVVQPGQRTRLSPFAGDQYRPDYFSPTDSISVSGENALSNLQSRHWDGSEYRFNFVDDFFKANESGTAAIRNRLPYKLIYNDDSGAANYNAGWSVGTQGRMSFSGNSFGRPVPFAFPASYEGPGISSGPLVKTYTFQLSYRHSAILNTLGTETYSPTPYMYFWNGLSYPARPLASFDPTTVATNLASVRLQGDNLNRFVMTGPSNSWTSSNNVIMEALRDITIHWHIDVANNRMRVLATAGVNDFNVLGAELYYSGFRSMSSLNNLGPFVNSGFGFSNSRRPNFYDGVSVYGYGTSRRDILSASGRY